MTTGEEHSCSHCGITYRWSPIVQKDNPQQYQLNFCCRGCHGAYQLICSAGLADFYSRNDRTTPTVDASLSRFTAEELAGYILPERDFCRLDILVGGISCPSCIWLLERMIGRIEGVHEVSISYAGGIASLRFNPLLVQPLDIFAVVSSLGYSPRPYSHSIFEETARREKQDLLIRFGTALFLVMQLMAYSYSLYAGYFQGMADYIKNFLQYVSMLVATPVVFYCGWPFLYGAWKSVLSQRPGMDLLIAIGALSAWSYSVWGTITRQETYFESAAMIITFVLSGRLLEIMVKQKAMSGIESLYAAVPQRAILENCEGSCVEVAVDTLHPGDTVLIRQGEKFPVDCLIVRGGTDVDQALVTGESLPVFVKEGDEVRAGSVNSGAPVSAQVLRPVGQSYLMRVAALVQMAQAGKPSLQRLADRVAGWFVPAVVFLAISVLVYGIFHGTSTADSIMRALAVVLIACPCAMGLAVPTAVLAACSRSASLGIIVRGGDVVEKLAAIRHICFDKTGTITIGKPTVQDCLIFGSYSFKEVLTATVTIEQMSLHPLAAALRCYAAESGILPGKVNNVSSFAGLGMIGTMEDGSCVICGNKCFLNEQGIKINNHIYEKKMLASGYSHQIFEDKTAVWIAIAGKLVACFLLQDQLRIGAERLVSTIKKDGIIAHLISGDSQTVTNSIAISIGIMDSRGGMLPDEKLAFIGELQQEDCAVMMVGDGVNDAPSLAAANVSCSLVGSSDIALENADVIITGDDISRLATAHIIAKKTMIVIKQNLAWAFVYNIIGIPLAMTGMLTPLYSSVAMVASSLLVSLNSLRLMSIKHRV